jgi:ATP-dependent DNA helicase PIF1
MIQAQALDILLSGRSAFLTGPPGAGKTYVLNEFVRRARYHRRRVAVTASTGIAATHVGGMTIHRWSGLGAREKLTAKAAKHLLRNEGLRRRYRETDVLVIDEVSMLHGSRLNLLNEACQLFRSNRAPFGGLQIVLAGDLFQLPPVTRAGEVPDFVHVSAAWAAFDPGVCYLTEQHRQEDDSLLEVLQAMRGQTIRQSHIDALQSRIGDEPSADTPLLQLCTHNRHADEVNQRHLAVLTGKSRTYGTVTRGQSSDVGQLAQGVLAPETLELKADAEVMFVVNNPGAGYANGTRGRVVGFRRDLPRVRLTTGKTITVEPHRWVLTEDGRERAQIMQLPLRLGWAITIHKSQGMSLDAAVIDLRQCFTPGMGYVGLSRVRSLDGVYLTGINRMALQMHPDIVAVDQALREASARLERMRIKPARARSAPRVTRPMLVRRNLRPHHRQSRRRKNRELAQALTVVGMVAACAIAVAL